MNGEFPYCETDPFMDELKQAAFDTIYKYGSEECDEWIKDLIACYPHEVVDALGTEPTDAYAALEEMWETTDYEDPRTGFCMTYKKWAACFAVEYGLEIYEELVKAKKELKEQRNRQIQNQKTWN